MRYSLQLMLHPGLQPSELPQHQLTPTPQLSIRSTLMVPNHLTTIMDRSTLLPSAAPVTPKLAVAWTFCSSAESPVGMRPTGEKQLVHTSLWEDEAGSVPPLVHGDEAWAVQAVVLPHMPCQQALRHGPQHQARASCGAVLHRTGPVTCLSVGA